MTSLSGLPLFTDHNPRVDRILDTDGDGTGTKNANVDGSVMPVFFKINPPATGNIVLARMIITVRDGPAFSAEKYGSIATPLANGVQVGVFNTSDDSLAIDYLDGMPVVSNAGWGSHSFDVDLKTWGGGDQILVARWTFARAGVSTILKAGDTQYFGVKIQDNLTGLVEHFFTVQGYIRNL